MKLTIHLRDMNKDIVNAWRIIFRNHDDIKVSCGDIFDIEADAIISPANSFGFMNGGIDLVYSEYFGRDLQKNLQAKIQDVFYGELPVGQATIINTEHERIKYLISAPTMRTPADVSKTINAYLAFRASLVSIKNFNETKIDKDKISSVLCPGLGTLTGGISPKDCAIQMLFAYAAIIENKIPFPKSTNEVFFEGK